MSFDPLQVYSATYSNVPVFEFVTSEGPIMRRKADSWINATHILKIAKYPKARRTRILEKDVQTGIHEKVQGGYGKYQGTYVPLEIGKELALSFGVYDILKPIFDFEFIEGKSLTPPPAPKHNHASASNVGRKLQQKMKNEGSEGAILAKRTRSGTDVETSPKRKPRAKRVTLTGRGKPDINRSQTVPIDSIVPSIGSFSARDLGLQTTFKLPPLQRQDTERDSALFRVNSVSVRREDLEPESGDELDSQSHQPLSKRHEPMHPSSHPNRDLHPADRYNASVRDSYDDELMTGRELFGSREFTASKESFEKYGAPPSRGLDSAAASADLPKLLGGDSLRSFPLQRQGHPHLNSTSLRGDPESIEYFNILLNYLLDESPGAGPTPKMKTTLVSTLPEKVLNPPQPLGRVAIDQPIDSDGNTIFHWSCAMANAPMMEFLLSLFSSSINTEIRNFRGETPLMFLVQFNNSYIFNNFSAVFDLLFDSVLSTDNFGRTVLHHIALACEPPAQSENGHTDVSLVKESFAKYYFEVILAKIVKFPEFLVHNENQVQQGENKKDVMVKFINHQDNEGNTALHIVAFSLARKCIRTFIRYHVYIDFNLRNLVNCTIEDYLASHNYVLRLEGDNDELLPLVGGTLNGNAISNPTYGAQSFESQMLSTRLALSLHASVAHRVTEQLSKLSFLVEKELKEYDEKIFNLLEFYKLIGRDKIASQKAFLHLFNLDYLLEDAEKEFETNLMSSQAESKYLDSNERSNDHIIQEEIKRLSNDLCFQYLTLEYDFEKAFLKYLSAREKQLKAVLIELVGELKVAQPQENQSEPQDVKRETAETAENGTHHGAENGTDNATDNGEVKEKKFAPNKEEAEQLRLATKLQKLILQRRDFSKNIYLEEVKLPYAAQFPDEFKENSVRREVTNGAVEPSKGAASMIAGFPKTDKLYKYCKLISLSCGMTFAEVENSVDLIEQSLARSST